MKILLIDDDLDDQTLFVDAVQQLTPDITVVCASDGIQGLKALTDGTPLPDIIFLDINMPRMDGRETLSNIMSSRSLRNIPIIMYSTSISEQELAVYKRSGIGCMIKPNSYELLVQQLRNEFITRQILSAAELENQHSRKH